MSLSLLESLSVAREGFDWRLRTVRRRDWARPTPCSEWSVRDVVNHVVGQEFRMAGLLRGGSLDDFLRLRDEDMLGPDAIGAWERGCAELDSALAEPGALERTVQYRAPIPGKALVSIRVFDLVVHTWDLAKGMALDERLDEGIVQAILDKLPFVPQAGEAFGAMPEELRDEMSPQERLLCICGRSMLSI